MRLLKVQVQSQDCPWLWQGTGLGFGKTRQVLPLLWKYPVWFSRQVAIRDLAVELRCVQSPRHSKILKGCGGFKHEPALCIWWMYLKPHQHHNLARKQRKPEIFDWRHFCSTVFNSGPQGEKEFLAGPFSDAAVASIAGFTPKQLACLLDGLTLAGDFGRCTCFNQISAMMQACRKLIVWFDDNW